MKEFAGRESELKFLEQYYGRPGSQLVVVYGSRGVGKTRLLQEFCRDKKSCYYLARACSDREQRFQWGAELRERDRELSPCPGYEELLSASLEERENGKQVLVIDEFHHMLKGDSPFFDSLAKFLESRPAAGPVMTVLCTSASGWVENHLVGKIGSRAAAIGGFLKVRELPFGDILRLFPRYTTDECIRGYAALGGVPGYWMCFAPEMGVRENIIKNIVARESRLHQELELYLEQELREPGVYNTILAAMAGGNVKLNDIYRHTGFSRAKISVYLKNLMELDMVEKVYSYDTEGRANARKGIYRITNTYVSFYFRYLFPNRSLLQLLAPEEFYEKKVAPSYDLYAEEAYRRICRERMGREYRIVGEWLGKAGAIDIVGSDGRGTVAAACCMYSRAMRYEDYENLLASMKKAKLSSGDIRLYCEKGFDDRLAQAEREGRLRLFSV